jgi:hypothetical protein
MKMFGELRLNRAMTDEQIEVMRDRVRAPLAELPRIEDAVKLEQVERFAKEVMPAFKGSRVDVKQPALAK